MSASGPGKRLWISIVLFAWPVWRLLTNITYTDTAVKGNLTLLYFNFRGEFRLLFADTVSNDNLPSRRTWRMSVSVWHQTLSLTIDNGECMKHQSLFSVGDQVPSLVPQIQNLLYGMAYPFGHLGSAVMAMLSPGFLCPSSLAEHEKPWTQGKHCWATTETSLCYQHDSRTKSKT